MSGRFVRASKFRHVFGRSTKKEQCYDNIRVSANAWDTNLIKVNPEYLSVNWQASGGGAFAVIPLEERGKLPDRIPLFRGHTAAVLDTDWNPFHDDLLASASDDGKVALWKVPEDFTLKSKKKPDEIEDVSPVSKLAGHPRKVGHVLFNPAAENVLASASGDYTIKIWDLENGQPRLTLNHGDIIQSLSWSANGAMMVTTCRDKKLRVWDTRAQKPALETPGHSGAKNSRVVWMGEHDRVATTGFSKMSDRQLGLWDIRAAREPIDGFQILDQISGVCMPFWDDGTNVLFLAGKGDGNIRYYEYENDKFEYLSQYSSPDPQRGVAIMPKRGVNTHETELTRAFKSVNDQYIEPISFIAPRRAEAFQSDIYPPCQGTKPAVTASQWFSGKDGIPPKISLESVHEGTGPQEVSAENTPSSVQPPAPQSKPEEQPVHKEREPPQAAAAPATIGATRGPPPSLNENKESLADIASKYDEKSEESSDDETSSFEEVPKPAERPTAGRAHPSTFAPIPASTPTSATAKPSEMPSVALNPQAGARSTSSTSTLTEGSMPTARAPEQPSSASTGHRSTPSGSLSGATQNLKGHLDDIRSLVETQNSSIKALTDKIDKLTSEVEALKTQQR
ncbi:MAG: hypothetical protein Q9162_001740 [Coniocarpon cinnabarinum]